MAGRGVLVTGAGGFIGMNLCQHLVQRGFSVRGIDRHYAAKTIQRSGDAMHLETGDFRDTGLMARLLHKMDCVIHLASAHLQVNLDAKEFWDINVKSMEPLLEQALKAGIHRFVHVSSVGVYGRVGREVVSEETPCHPQSVYGETKLAGEQVVLEFARRTGFPVVVLRPAWVYGLYCPRTRKLYNTLKKKRFVMVGPGQNYRHPVYIEDFCRAAELAMDLKEALGEVFIIAGPEILTSKQLVERFAATLNLTPPCISLPYAAGVVIARISESIFSALGKEPLFSRRSLEFFNTDNAFDISKARRHLAFEPDYDFVQGLNHCRSWLENQGL